MLSNNKSGFIKNSDDKSYYFNIRDIHEKYIDNLIGKKVKYVLQ